MYPLMPAESLTTLVEMGMMLGTLLTAMLGFLFSRSG